MKSDCERFEEVLRKMEAHEDITDEEIDFYIVHEDTCERTGHKAPTLEDLRNDPRTRSIIDTIEAEIHHDLGLDRK